VVEARPDILLDASEPPFRQGVDFRTRGLAPSDVHHQRLGDAARKFAIGRMALFGQRLCELLGERVAQQKEIVQAFGRERLRSLLWRWKAIGRDVEVQEIARRKKLRAERLRRRADIERARRHGAVENGLTASGQLETCALQGDREEVPVGRRRCILAPDGRLRIGKARDRDVLARDARALLGLAPFSFVGECACPLREIRFAGAGLMCQSGAGRLHIGEHRSSRLLDSAAAVTAAECHWLTLERYV